MDEINEIRKDIEDLYLFSKKLTEFKQNEELFLEALKRMDRNEIEKLINFYQNGEKVKELRYFIVKKIYSKEEINLRDIEKEKEKIREKNTTDVFKAWSNFSILFELYYKQYKDDIKSKLAKIHEYLRLQLKEDFNADKKISGFDWNMNFGHTGCWIALIPRDKDDHKECVHFYMAINYAEDQKIQFGLYYGVNIDSEKIDPDSSKVNNYFNDTSEIDISKILKYYNELLPEYRALNDALNDTKVEDRKNKLESITKKIDFGILESKFDEIPLYFDKREELKYQILTCLISNKNIIFFGPPGTGKTKLAEDICKIIYEHNKLNENIHPHIFTTATSDWTTFETIGGYMPNKDDQTLTFRNGLFLKCFRDEQGNPKNRWLVIDEINRADIDKAFGQLFSVLSGNPVNLPYLSDDGKEISIKPTKIDDFKEASVKWEKNVFYVTNMWRLLATMNTYDKASLYVMSYAFMRRFAFIHIDVPEINERIIEKLCSEKYWDIKIKKIQRSIKDLENLWKLINNYRKIGPAIIHDIIDYIIRFPDSEAALTYAIIQFVLPQFEGLDEELIKDWIIKINNLGTIKIDILKNNIRDMFDLKV